MNDTIDTEPEEILPTGKKPTEQERDVRIAEMIEYLGKTVNAHKTEIHAFFTARWGCHWITVDRYVIRAKKEMLDRLKRDKPEMICESMAFYEGIMRDMTAKPSERLRAAQLRDELLGLQEPKRTSSQISGDSLEIVVKHAHES